nr:MAG TPA_asm: tail assembly chaperone protein [Caudoviricetes sp.]
MAFKLHNKAKLITGLEKLTGKDFKQAEKDARVFGAVTIDITFSRVFHGVLAAKVYNVPYPELEMLPIKEYAQITNDVADFLMAPDTAEAKKALQK